MSSIARIITMAAAMCMANAIQIQTEFHQDVYYQKCREEPVGEKRWWWDNLVFDRCDQSVYLPGGVYEMRLQCNKYFVIKKHEDGKVYDLKAIKIDGEGEIGQMKMQYNGDLVVYNKENKPMWSTGTWGNRYARLYFQDDGNLVIYHSKAGGCKDQQHALWASDTSLPAQRYNYVWENDEKVIEECGGLLQHTQGHPNKGTKYQYMLKLNCEAQALQILSSWPQVDHSKGGFKNWFEVYSHPLDRAGPDAIADHLVMQTDGNLVVYSTKGEAMWASDTAGNPGAFAEFHDDGNFTVKKHAPGGAVTMWETGPRAQAAWQTTTNW